MKKALSCVLVALLLVCSLSLFACRDRDGGGGTETPTPDPVKEFRLIVPEAWELPIGDSRSVDSAFTANVTDRNIVWTTSSEAIATVDKWGRVTAVSAGEVTITGATADGHADSVVLHVVTEATAATNAAVRIVDFNGTAIELGDNLQKIITRYMRRDTAVPADIRAITEYTDVQTATTADGAVWSVTNYGVLRTHSTATIERDREQRFMGDRYFYSNDTTNGNVQGIVADGANGIWTIMSEGYTHIEMIHMTGTDKAAQMAATTEEYVSRRGMVSEAYYNSDMEDWRPNESDNDGLWTSMYAVGELMRYSVLKESGTATADELKAARDSAYLSTEAVLLLSNICMRQGTVEAYVRYQPNAEYDPADGRYLSETALEKGGDASIDLPEISPAAAFSSAYTQYLTDGSLSYFLEESYLRPYTMSDWSDPLKNAHGEYEYRTRNLEGFISRTYSLAGEGNVPDGYIHWQHNGDGTATGVSTKTSGRGYLLNGENLRGVTVDASGEIPTRLWNDLLGEGYSVEDIVYKGDTSSDEIIGHMFLYKVAYDILGPEDAEIKQIIVNTMDRFAQHISDNSYMMVDGSGQPDTWAKFNRAFFCNSSQLGGAPLTSSVILSVFKVAAYVTGDVRWENEYRMAALDPSYEYAKLMAQYGQQCYMVLLMTLKSGVEVGGSKLDLNEIISVTEGSALAEMMTRMFLNYSDEEMAMLAFYLLFQLETDETLLNYYRQAIDQWWVSIQYSENPLWYYIYQLAYPNELKKDAYGNNVIETAAWSLSRHPIDTRKWCASNTARDDYAELDISDLGVDGHALCYKIEDGKVIKMSSIADALSVIGEAAELNWGTAAPDERALHKYNGTSAELDGNHNIYEMEGATTYSLPFWLGMYHGMLTDIPEAE